MRELKRSIAKAVMRDMGYKRLFKRGASASGVRGKSVFALNWKNFVIDRYAKKNKKKRGRRTA